MDTKDENHRDDVSDLIIRDVKKIGKFSGKESANQLQFVRLSVFLRKQIKKVQTIHVHYEIWSLISVLMIREFKCNNNEYLNNVLCLLNCIANIFFFIQISPFTESRLQIFFMTIARMVYPLPTFITWHLSMNNSVHDLIFCFYLHRAWYVMRLISFYKQYHIDKLKQLNFKNKFNLPLFHSPASFN